MKKRFKKALSVFLASIMVIMLIPQSVFAEGDSLQITKQPVDFTVTKMGETASFTVEAEGEGLSYAWQASTNGGSTWAYSSMPGYNTATFQPQTSEQRLSYQFRCIVKDSSGRSVTSDIVKMVKAVVGPTITVQPVNYEGKIGDTATFTVVAQGEEVAYRWQASTNGGSSWANSSMPGYNTASFMPQMTEQRLNYQFRCIVTDSKGNSVTSNAVKMVKAVEGPKITTQPVDYEGKIGDTATFTVVAEGEGLSYHWQASTNGGSTWANSSMPGYNTATFKPQMTEQRLAYQFRCVVKDSKGNSVTSDPVKMVKAAAGLKITRQPVDYEGKIGETAAFAVAAEGEGLTYRWQASTNGGSSWANSSMPGYNTATFQPQITAQRLNYQFRCVVKDSKGNSAVTEVVVMKLKAETHKVTYDAGEGAFPAGGIFAKAESEWGYTFNQNRTAASENLEVGGHYIPDWIAPEREGYNFLGWTLNGKVVRNVNVTDSDITLTAVWEAGIKVTYDANGGYWLFDEEEGSFTTFDMIQPAGAYYLGWHEPQRDGYQFAGWTVNDQYVSRINLTQPVTVKATWNKIYTVTYDANGGKFYNVWDDAQQKEITGTTMTRIQNDGNMNYWVGVSGDEEPVYAAQNEEMVFCGWSTNKNATPGEANMGFEVVATGNFTVYAIWTKGYTVTLNANGGVLYYENDVAVTSKAYTDYNPGEGFELFLRPEHREGCEFLGWSTNQKATEPTYGDWDRVYPTVNTTLYAIWQKYPTITYDANGGYWNEWDNEKQEDVQVFYRYEWRKNGQRCHVRNQAPDREGYRFDGWMDANGNVIEEENPLVMDKDYIVKAKWVKQIQVTYNANGGSWGNETLRYWDGEEGLVHIGEEWPQWNGNGEMCFAGWSTSPNATQADADFDVELHDDAVYYAIWCRPFTVTFDANGGWLWEDRDGFVTTDTRESVWYGDFDVDQWANRDGYEFLGWSTNKNAKAAEYPINGSGEERRAFLKQATTFYAVWEKLPWITYDANGGCWGGYEPENQIDERETTRVDWDKAGYYYYVGQEQPWRDGYEFNGWVDAQGNPADEREIIMGEDLTFYASWAKRIDVVYNANGGKFETGEGDMDEHVQNDVRTETEYWLDGWEPHYRLENGGEYYFVGWSLDPKGTEPIENPWMIPSNIEVDEHNCITLYAIWDEGITVTYNGNGGEWWISDDPEGGNWYSVNVREEGPYRSDEQTYHIGTWWPDREGYMFVGWSTNPRATDAMTDFDAALTQNTTYYAIWDKMPVITFNAGEGSFGNDAAAAGSTTITVPWRPGGVLDYDRTFDTGNQNIEPTRQGYRFNGWVDKDGNQFRYIRITGDVEVYASWVKAD